MQIDLIQVFTLILIVLISMSLHEMTHAYVGYWLGDDTAKHEGRLTFNPIAHIDPFMTVLLPIVLMLIGGPIFGGAKPVPFDPSKVKWGEFGAMLVGISGPISNLVLAFAGALALVITGVNTGILVNFLQLWILVNLGFFLFNILPIPPLDGSRVLYYLAPENVRRVFVMIEQYGLILVFVLVFLFSQYIGMYMQFGIDFFLNIFSILLGKVL